MRLSVNGWGGRGRNEDDETCVSYGFRVIDSKELDSIFVIREIMFVAMNRGRRAWRQSRGI
jgi:hypothetical protein